MTPVPNSDPAPRLALIAARARNGVIGVNGALPWRLPGDLAFFKRATMGKPILMGRRTWDSLGGPLPGRPHLVLSRSADARLDGAETFARFEDMVAAGLDRARRLGVDEAMVIGGGEVYRLALPIADRLYLTEVDAAPRGDAVFPAFDAAEWVERARERHEADDRHAHAFVIRTLDRRTHADPPAPQA